MVLNPIEAARNVRIDQGNIGRELVGLEGLGCSSCGGGVFAPSNAAPVAIGAIIGYLVGKSSAMSVLGGVVGYLWNQEF